MPFRIMTKFKYENINFHNECLEIISFWSDCLLLDLISEGISGCGIYHEEDPSKTEEV